ncbi:MAG TPA: GNAT family N-acetyltransferase [Candidatus Limnocylindria bacterium]
MGVRRATVDDAEAFERIRIGTWQATYRGLFPDALLDGMRPNVERRRDRLRELSESHPEFCFVAEVAGEVVGFAIGCPERTGDPVYKGEIAAIYVLPAHQGKGLGRALSRESVRELAGRGMTSLLIWVLRENRIGRAFYEGLGGVPRREKPVDMPGIPKCHVEVAYCWDDTAALLA